MHEKTKKTNSYQEKLLTLANESVLGLVSLRQIYS